MIEIKFNGANGQEALNDMLAFANIVAVGMNITQAQQAQQAADAAKVVEPAPEAPKPKAKAKKPEPAAQADIEDVFADDDVEEVENVESDKPVPKNVDELRALVMKAHAKIGAVKGSAIVTKYAPKVKEVPADKYADIARDLYKALEA